MTAHGGRGRGREREREREKAQKEQEEMKSPQVNLLKKATTAKLPFIRVFLIEKFASVCTARKGLLTPMQLPIRTS